MTLLCVYTQLETDYPSYICVAQGSVVLWESCRHQSARCRTHPHQLSQCMSPSHHHCVLYTVTQSSKHCLNCVTFCLYSILASLCLYSTLASFSLPYFVMHACMSTVCSMKGKREEGGRTGRQVMWAQMTLAWRPFWMERRRTLKLSRKKVWTQFCECMLPMHI